MCVCVLHMCVCVLHMCVCVLHMCLCVLHMCVCVLHMCVCVYTCVTIVTWGLCVSFLLQHPQPFFLSFRNSSWSSLAMCVCVRYCHQTPVKVGAPALALATTLGQYVEIRTV
eukprot:GHVR01147222.1.p1 GENE.GHVR01147222.1~~GHVR01147222.1.p1  ORF type:complete len:112 (-),score=36.82 GHVR01147222.1:191-526(-)